MQHQHAALQSGSAAEQTSPCLHSNTAAHRLCMDGAVLSLVLLQCIDRYLQHTAPWWAEWNGLQRVTGYIWCDFQW